MISSLVPGKIQLILWKPRYESACGGLFQMSHGVSDSFGSSFLAEGECNVHYEKPPASICETVCEAQDLHEMGGGALSIQLCSISPRNTSGKAGVRCLPEWVGRTCFCLRHDAVRLCGRVWEGLPPSYSEMMPLNHFISSILIFIVQCGSIKLYQVQANWGTKDNWVYLFFFPRTLQIWSYCSVINGEGSHF